jgi:hypothetical protein
MFKRIMLALTFMATLGTVGVGLTQPAEAWGRWRRPWVARYYGPPAYYDAYVPYRTYYYGPRYYRMGGPYYGYPAYYYDGPGYWYAPRGGVSVSFGF